MARATASLKAVAALSLAGCAIAGVTARALALTPPAGSGDSTLSVAVDAPSTSSAPAAVRLPPITVEQLPSAPVVPAATGTDAVGTGGSLQQVLVLDIAGGSMSVAPESATVLLHRVKPGRYEGAFGPVTVTDARGSLAGWVLTATADDASGTLTATPSPAVAVTGRPGEASAAPTARLDGAGMALMVAPSGGGGGQFQVSGAVRLDVGGDTVDTPPVIPVTLHFRAS